MHGNATSQKCEVCDTPVGLLVGGEPSLLRTHSGGLTEKQRNLEWQETAILFEPEEGQISVLKHLI